MAVIKQSDNYSANFGITTRTSALFWIPPYAKAKTSFLLSNYWRFKNNIQNIRVIASFRFLGGGLVARKSIGFESSDVYSLQVPEEMRAEGGSAEIEVISTDELRIPYAAIMVAYEAEKSLSMVHSYSRIYSTYEEEEERVITSGHEACWTLRDNEKIESFGVFHNGRNSQAPQMLTLNVRNNLSKSITAQVSLPELKPYETVLIKPSDYIDNLQVFLDGKPGSASLDFDVKVAFTRMLVGWTSKNGDELQVTHSNFNYSVHQTDFVSSEGIDKRIAFMRLPAAPFKTKAVIYPDYAPGEYLVAALGSEDCIFQQITNGLRVELEAEKLLIKRSDNLLPSRIVTAVQQDNCKYPLIPFECSLGVIHFNRPPKRFHWGLIHVHYRSILAITSYPEIYGDPSGAEIKIKILTANGDVHEKTIYFDDNSASMWLEVEDLIPEGLSESCIEYGYIIAFSEYGGFVMFTAINKRESWTMEHTF